MPVADIVPRKVTFLRRSLTPSNLFEGKSSDLLSKRAHICTFATLPACQTISRWPSPLFSSKFKSRSWPKLHSIAWVALLLLSSVQQFISLTLATIAPRGPLLVSPRVYKLAASHLRLRHIKAIFISTKLHSGQPSTTHRLNIVPRFAILEDPYKCRTTIEPIFGPLGIILPEDICVLAFLCAFVHTVSQFHCADFLITI